MSIKKLAYTRLLEIGLPKPRHDDWMFFPKASLEKMEILPSDAEKSESLNASFDLGIETEKNVAALLPLIRTQKTFLKTVEAKSQEIGMLKARDDFSHTIFNIGNEAQASLEIVDNKNQHPFNAERLDFFLGEGAELELFFSNPPQQNELFFRHIRIVAAANASVKIYGFQQNTGTYRHSFDIILNGEKANADFRLLNVVGSGTQAHYHLILRQNAPHTQSNQLVRHLLNGNAHVSYDGAVHVAKDCTQANSAQLINSILLSEESRVSIKPVLKIYHDDVECTHGSTCGELDAESLYYLESRGIEMKKAEQILLQNFATVVFSGLDSSIGVKRMMESLTHLFEKTSER